MLRVRQTRRDAALVQQLQAGVSDDKIQRKPEDIGKTNLAASLLIGLNSHLPSLNCKSVSSYSLIGGVQDTAVFTSNCRGALHFTLTSYGMLHSNNQAYFEHIILVYRRL